MIYEFPVSKIGKTVRGGYTDSLPCSIELITHTEGEAFQRTSFAVKLTRPAYVRQSSAPGTYALEEELPARTYFRVDVEDPTERFLYVQGTGTAYGEVRATEITKVDGTTSADTTQYGILATGALASGKRYGWSPSDGLGVSGTSALATLERYSFSADTLTVASSISVPRTEALALGSATYGYIGGGQDAVHLSFYSSVERYHFSTDTINGLTAAFIESRGWATAAGNSTVGIANGGRLANTKDAASDLNRVTSEKLTYATEAIVAGSDIYNGSAATDNALRSAAASPTVGYWRGGTWWSLNYSGTYTVQHYTTYQYAFATDVVTGTTPNLSAARMAMGAAASATQGIWAGGTAQAVANANSLRTIETLVFATATNTATTNVLTTGRRMVAALSNSTVAVFCGGYATGVNTALATSEKIDFGTVVAVAAAALSTATGSQVGASNCHGGIS